MHQHRRAGEPVIVIGELRGMFAAVDEVGNEISKRLKHDIPVSAPSSLRLQCHHHIAT
jgi:hypothetical protein